MYVCFSQLYRIRLPKAYQFEVELNVNEKPRQGRAPKKVRIHMNHVNAIDFG